jgi:hypothetical protein
VDGAENAENQPKGNEVNNREAGYQHWLLASHRPRPFRSREALVKEKYSRMKVENDSDLIERIEKYKKNPGGMRQNAKAHTCKTKKSCSFFCETGIDKK